jgi:hypothetical protein
MATDDWEARLAGIWAAADDLDETELRGRIDALAAELREGDPVGLFERGGAFDSTGHSDRAVPLYRAALAAGLEGERRRRAVIQLSSSLRNTGHVDEAMDLLTGEMARGSDHFDDAVRVVLALCLADAGREREGLALVVEALAAHLPRYQRSMADYARALVPAPPP